MIDANEAWGAKEAIVKLEAIRRAGYEDLLWVEDPILRHDFEGLRLLRESVPWTLINSGEYLDAAGKRQLMIAGGTDILNVHGQVTDVMRIGWLAAEMGIPVIARQHLPRGRRAHGVRPARGRVAGILVPEFRAPRRRAHGYPRWLDPCAATGPAMGWCFANPRAANGRAPKSCRATSLVTRLSALGLPGRPQARSERRMK